MRNNLGRAENDQLLGSVFEVTDYRKFISQWIASHPNSGRGLRAQLAERMGCQLPFVSHVLAGRNSFSGEQAEACARFLKLRGSEIQYFVFLVASERAGTPELKKFYADVLAGLRRSRTNLEERVQPSHALRDQDRARYYSDWIYSAVHVASSTPAFQTPEKLAQGFQVSEETILRTLEFLESCGLVKKASRRYVATPLVMHLSKDSPFICMHHESWRRAALQFMRVRGPEGIAAKGLHYSGALSCAARDVEKIRQRLSQFLADASAIVKESQTSDGPRLAALNFDFFELLE